MHQRRFDFMQSLLTAAAILLILAVLLAQWEQGRQQDIQLDTLSTRLDALEAQTDDIRSLIEVRDQQIQTQLETILEALDDEFEPWPIPLDPELQAHTYMRSQQTGIPVDLLFAVMWTESGMQWHDPVMDSNGYYSVGYSMINQVNWDWLAEQGINVHTPAGNIDAMVYILWLYQEKGYTVEQCLAAYNAGEAGMLRGGGMRYVNAVQEVRYDSEWHLGPSVV